MSGSEVHIVHGDVAGGVLRLAIGCAPESILVQHDPLSVGPLPRYDSLEDFRALREKFWQQIYFGPPPDEGANNLYANAYCLHDTDITIWLGAGASDQFLLPWVVHLLRLIDAPIPRLSVVQFERLPPRNFYVPAIAVLSPAKVKTYGQRRQLCEDEVAEIEAIWSALTSPVPNDLLRSIDQHRTRVPLLRRAVRTVVDGYPDISTGLSHWDEELLNSVRIKAPSAVRTIAEVLASSYDTDYPRHSRGSLPIRSSATTCGSKSCAAAAGVRRRPILHARMRGAADRRGRGFSRWEDELRRGQWC